MQKREIILAIETSCDETAAAVLADGQDILANVVASQIKIHQKYGGVVPEIASRHHLEQVNLVVDLALQEAGITFDDLTAIAVTYGPGLVGALLVGVSTAKALAYALKLPLVGVNHIEGHIYANWLGNDSILFPVVCLVVSGGHTALVEMQGHGRYRLLGQTLDDAAGEAYDKVARAMGLGYPGGPLLESLAKEGDEKAIALPRAWLGDDNYDFSFSGLKSAVLNYLNRAAQKGEEVNKADLAASFQASVVEVLVEKTVKAARVQGVKTVLLAGGVAANSSLRKYLHERCSEENLELLYPPFHYCTDNAAMIACAGYYRYKMGERADWYLNAVPNLKLY
ncbi:tRNA (adenosine(37)-N6)-threonylcarbamoyltransferase complex transferase subunit TsaD [Thermanaerosceptrum fracticalcis]|uniref:tRNA N6-adenosine threonylcarbamoyltransferase n=1 Tax=Thermanaerosceptrum fracticalcis TaxID=1712410 RepID=A0A7G6E3C8_THEFR|nr:tRNA (adenosine(37)-N6)-threonylcarbamoyltransferase complex transferase subunit TsaD [Thermanaerosceptrum fracticalcis]QNB46582.1 tRNA (adenosine(37)-N6)-threonylcarbamoyltransferase complex transferase subunit TsaD [Thermanaerosceptrum fracticalcis]